MLKIYIDIGNTFTKYTTSQNTQVVQIATALLLTTKQFASLEQWAPIEQWREQSIEVYLSCVQYQLIKKIENYFWTKAQVFFLTFQNQQLISVKNHQPQDQKSEIGSDIVANAIAVTHLASDALVISLGTAIVYFTIHKSEIQGVAITSGFEMSLKAFYEKIWPKNTIKASDLKTPAPLLGLNTHDAISAGFINSQIFAINGFIKALTTNSTKIFITGGDYHGLALSLDQHLNVDYIYQSNLVLDGLKRWAQKGIKKNH